jgi:hypothetical protein
LIATADSYGQDELREQWTLPTEKPREGVQADQTAAALRNLWDRSGRFQGSVDRRGNIFGTDGRLVARVERRTRTGPGLETFWGSDTPRTSPRTLPRPSGARSRLELRGLHNERLGEVDQSGQVWSDRGVYLGQIPDLGPQSSVRPRG